MIHMEPEYELGGILVNASRWWQNGDHPKDEYTEPSPDEGKFVRRFRHPNIGGTSVCNKCGYLMHDHGWVDCGGDGVTVCPGDWVVEGKSGDIRSIKDDEFRGNSKRII